MDSSDHKAKMVEKYGLSTYDMEKVDRAYEIALDRAVEIAGERCYEAARKRGQVINFAKVEMYFEELLALIQ